MTDQITINYYKVRESQARALSAAAVNPGIRAIHLEMAERYAALSQDGIDLYGTPGKE